MDRMATKNQTAGSDAVTWLQIPEDIIVLVNRSEHNFILDLPTGRYRLDAGRRMRTLRSILNSPQVIALVHEGQLVIE
jgi:hypothetical protein